METKPWYLSRTVWYGICMVALGIGQAAGLIGPDQASSLLATVPDTIIGLLGGLLGALVVHGRIATVKKIE